MVYFIVKIIKISDIQNYYSKDNFSKEQEFFF